MNDEQKRELESRIRGLEYQTNPDRDRQVLDTLCGRFQEIRTQSKPMERIEMILHCTSVRAAVAALVVLIVIGGLWQGSANKAWALEHVLTALERVRTIHVRGTLLYGEESEPKAFSLWVQAPGEDSGPLRLRFECSRLVIILEGERVYMCRPDKGRALLRHGPEIEYFMPWYDAVELGPWISGKMFKALQQVFADWEQSVVTDPETGREKIIVSCRYVPTNTVFRATVDSDTKLIDKAKIRSKSPFSDVQVHIDAQGFAYNQDISPGTFALPEGVVVIDEAARKKAEPLLDETVQLYEKKQYAKALALLQRVCDEYPGLHDEVAAAHLVRGHCYRALGQHEEAIKAYQESIDKVMEGGIQRPRFLLAVAYLGMGRTHMELKQNAEALEAFEACVRECEGAPEPEKWFREEALEQIEKLREP